MTPAMTVSDKPRLSHLAAECSVEEKAFCEALVANPGITGKDAAIKAGWSPRSAHVLASRALDRPRVQAYLKALKNEIDNPGEKAIRRKVMSARAVLARLSAIGRASLKPHMAFNGEGEFVGINVDPDHADGIRQIKTKQIMGIEGAAGLVETEVRIADPLPALQTLAKYHGLEKAPKSQDERRSNVLAILALMPDSELRKALEAENVEDAEVVGD